MNQVMSKEDISNNTPLGKISQYLAQGGYKCKHCIEWHNIPIWISLWKINTPKNVTSFYVPSLLGCYKIPSQFLLVHICRPPVRVNLLIACMKMFERELHFLHTVWNYKSILWKELEWHCDCTCWHEWNLKSCTCMSSVFVLFFCNAYQSLAFS